MGKYYKPTEEELIVGLDIELFTDLGWGKCTIEKDSRSVWKEHHIKGDLRVKYLDSDDFNLLGYAITKNMVGKQEVIVDILPDNTEVTEEITIFDEESLNILKNKIKVGEFYPWKPEQNVKIEDKEYTVRNLSELRKILK